MCNLRFAILRAKLVFLNEIILFRVFTALTLAEVPPATADEVSDDYRDDDQPKNLVDIEQEIVLHDSFIA